MVQTIIRRVRWDDSGANYGSNFVAKAYPVIAGHGPASVPASASQDERVESSSAKMTVGPE